MNFLRTNNVLSPCMNGFRFFFSFRHTLESIHCFLIFIKRMKKNYFRISILLDLENSFDTKSHEYLLRKALANGIMNVELNWFVKANSFAAKNYYITCKQSWNAHVICMDSQSHLSTKVSLKCRGFCIYSITNPPYQIY